MKLAHRHAVHNPTCTQKTGLVEKSTFTTDFILIILRYTLNTKAGK